jgi:hypothetical protein
MAVSSSNEKGCSMTDTPTPRPQPPPLRPLSMLIYTVVFIALSFAAALIDRASSDLLSQVLIFLLPVVVFVFSLFTYLICVINQNARVLLALVLVVSGSFVLSAAPGTPVYAAGTGRGLPRLFDLNQWRGTSRRWF